MSQCAYERIDSLIISNLLTVGALTQILSNQTVLESMVTLKSDKDTSDGWETLPEPDVCSVHWLLQWKEQQKVLKWNRIIKI